MKNPGFAGAVTGAVAVAVMLTAAGIDIDPGHAGNGVVIAFVIGIMAGGFCGLALRRGLRGAGSGFWQTTVGRYLIGRMAGSAVYTALTVALWKLSCYALAYSAVELAHAIGLQPVVAIIAAISPALPWLPWGLAGIGAWFLRTPAKIVIGKGSAPLRRFYRSLRMGQGGSAGFAGICEEWANRWRRGRIFLGHSLFDRKWPVGIKDDRMMTVLGGNGSGKDETIIIPNMLEYQNGSAFLIDIKGQDAAVTADARRRMGQTVHILDPFGSLKEGTAHLNPLDLLDPQSGTYVEDIYSIVDALVIAGNENNRFWTESARTVIAGAIDYAVRRRGDEFVPPEDFMEKEPVNE